MDSGRCKAYCKTEEKNGNCEGGNKGFAAILEGGDPSLVELLVEQLLG